MSETRNRGGHGGSVAEPDAAGGESCRQKGVATSICNTIETRPQTQATLRSLNGHLPYPAPSGAPGTDAVRGPGVHIGPGRSALRLSAGIGESASAPSKTAHPPPGKSRNGRGDHACKSYPTQTGYLAIWLDLIRCLPCPCDESIRTAVPRLRPSAYSQFTKAADTRQSGPESAMSPPVRAQPGTTRVKGGTGHAPSFTLPTTEGPASLGRIARGHRRRRTAVIRTPSVLGASPSASPAHSGRPDSACAWATVCDPL